MKTIQRLHMIVNHTGTGRILDTRVCKVNKLLICSLA